MALVDGSLQCDMRDGCKSTVTHIEDAGWIYCTAHATDRRAIGNRARKMRPWELKLLLSGEALPSYKPQRKPR